MVIVFGVGKPTNHAVEQTILGTLELDTDRRICEPPEKRGGKALRWGAGRRTL